MTSKNIVITGAARGIGRVIARHLCLQGHRLFLIDVDTQELAYTAQRHIPMAAAKSSYYASLDSKPGFAACNLRDPRAVREVIKKAAHHFGGHISVLINNAGIAHPMWTDDRTMEDWTVLEDWQAYIEINLTAPFVVSQACIPFMKMKDDGRADHQAILRPEAAAVVDGQAPETGEENSGACIINISSFRARQSQENTEGYAASKAGLLGLTHGMAISGAQWGIRSNAILPGYIEVQHENKAADESGKTWAEDVNESRHRAHPTGRVGRGEDIAKTVEWLMGAGFVNGEEIVVDGGASKIKFSGS